MRILSALATAGRVAANLILSLQDVIATIAKSRAKKPANPDYKKTFALTLDKNPPPYYN